MKILAFILLLICAAYQIGCGKAQTELEQTSIGTDVLTVELNDEDSTLKAGEEVSVSWEYSVEQPSLVAIEMSKDGGLTWEIVERQVKNRGEYLWTPPVEEGSAFRLRVLGDAEELEDSGPSTNVLAQTEDITVDATAPEVAEDQILTAYRGTPLEFQIASGEDLTTLKYTSVTNPSSGTITGCLDGTTSRNCTYTPTIGFLGSVEVTYKVTDAVGNDSTNTAKITINVLTGDNVIPARQLASFGGQTHQTAKNSDNSDYENADGLNEHAHNLLSPTSASPQTSSDGNSTALSGIAPVVEDESLSY